MGNALVDIMTRLESDSFLEKFSLLKGSMQLVNKDFSERVLKDAAGFEQKLSSGGSAANTIHGLANLGVQTGFFGKIGNDKLGDFFRSDMEKNNISTLLSYGQSDTGHAIALVSPDSERTFATYLGSAVELAESDITPELFKDYGYFHIEGYLVQNHKLIEKAVKVAKQCGLTVSLDLASFNVVESNMDFLKAVIKQYVDIVFANEEEAKVYTGEIPGKAIDIIAGDCNIAVVKVGEKGSLIKKGDKLHSVGIIPVKCIDTTGAGDLYAAGFIYGLVNGLPLEKCGRIGAILSGKVIEVMGAKMDESKWMEIKQMVKAC